MVSGAGQAIIHTVLLYAAQLPILTLDEALHTAARNQPQLRLAHANSEAAFARVGQARSAVLPQPLGVASYQRTTANFTPRPGLLPSEISSMGATQPSWATFDFFNFGLTLSQPIDIRAPFAFNATRSSAEAQVAGERSIRQQVELNVRAAFLLARQNKALARVAHETVGNQVRHLAQSRGFVAEGVRPEIDVAQAETNYASAEVQAITADNAYALAKVQLNQAMGVEQPIDFDVADDWLPEVPGEASPVSVLFDEAVRARPDLDSLERQVRAQRQTVSALKGGYAPAFGASMSLTDAGTALSSLVWNWNVTINATWTVFDGLLIYSQVKEARANLHGIESQRDLLRQQILVDVNQAWLQVRAAKVTLAAAEKTVASAHLQLTLAEGRYEQGIGNLIELGDAQLADTTARAQRVQAEYSLSVARALLLRALGRAQ